MATSARTKVVVAVVSWNTRALLDRCLRSLRDAAQAGWAEVWVVDNASTDGSAAMVRDEHPWVRLVASDENLGYGPAINLVADRTDSEWLVISNSDIAVRRGALERLLLTGAEDPDAGIVAPRLILPDGSTQHSVWAFPTISASLVQSLGRRVLPRRLSERFVLRGAWDAEQPRRVPWAIGAFLAIRRQAFREIGGFDRQQWMSAEDLDLGWRMRQAGWATRYEPHAVVEHEESAATGQVWGDDLAIHWQRCAYAWMVRRMGHPRTAAVGVIAFAGALLRLTDAALTRPPGWRGQVRGLARWALVHRYALAPRRVLARYR